MDREKKSRPLDHIWIVRTALIHTAAPMTPYPRSDPHAEPQRRRLHLLRPTAPPLRPYCAAASSVCPTAPPPRPWGCQLERRGRRSDALRPTAPPPPPLPRRLLHSPPLPHLLLGLGAASLSGVGGGAVPCSRDPSLEHRTPRC